ncbi:transcriptional repressor, CopY family [Syntrophobotulus glycolicus DSM 8271]|uniref:Transcriptional repressor, CopY family n=1 Tax=Syntrophobotulus glycolicus (strain DSM 8271 / FlGlyR) TaxID=645991 RepID=F0SWI7_SYNGF|nr:BlaI/MecI/CopY family transcriptional regulator [Syntrophobotulus glycolicus]ADY55753.1 transcriptional repressor, CopY family [Syntrophobotulus glycolicus DSM 8271]
MNSKLIKLFDSELKVMDILWNEGDTTAKRIAEILKEQVGWSKTTTYTVIKKCIDKGALERREPNFICHSLITKAEAQDLETTELINKMYDGAADQLVASILGRKNLSTEEILKLKQLVNDLSKF